MVQTRLGPDPRRKLRLATATLLLTGTATLVLFAHAPFSLIASFRSSSDGADCSAGDGVCGDDHVLSPAYRDFQDGAEVYSNDVGNVVLRTVDSPSRKICLDFPDRPVYFHDEEQFDRFVGSRNLNGCYPARFNTSANAEYGATDVGQTVPSPQPISASVTFFLEGVQFELQWSRPGHPSIASVGPPLKVAFSQNPDTWTLEPFTAAEIPGFLSDTCPNCKYDEACPEGCTTLMVFSERKPRGRIALANYVMPLQLVAERDPENKRRTKGRK